MKRGLASLMVLLSALPLIWGMAQDSDHPNVTGDNGVRFTINSVEWWDKAQKYTPKNGYYVVIFGELKNTSNSRQCVYAGQVDVETNGTHYSPDGTVMAAVKSDLEDEGEKWDYIGVLFGKCMAKGENSPIFIAFDGDKFDTATLTFLTGTVTINLNSEGEIILDATAEVTASPTDKASVTSTPAPTRKATTQAVQTPSQGFVCPSNCADARAMGLTAEQAATCPGLDRNHNGVACYGS